MDRLIYDVGVCNGDDSAYYLTKAEKVIGVEASPVACEMLRERFAGQIASGRYVLVNAGVAAEQGDLDFWISDQPEWSSFDRRIAGRRGTGHRSVKVPTRMFSSILDEFGVPDFLKVDIEGHDHLCILSLTAASAPENLSVELGPKTREMISHLHEVGYTGFKFISQRTHAPAVPALCSLVYRLPSRLKRLYRRLDKRFNGAWRDGDWIFAPGSSGPLSSKTTGKWMSVERALETHHRLCELDRKTSSGGLEDWFDIHATRALA